MPENTKVEQEKAELVDTIELVEATSAAYICPKCNRPGEQSRRSPHMCVDCEKVENSRYTYMRMHQDNWVEIAEESGLDLWVQQPGETQWEYSVWCAYRDSYPGKKPSYGDVARQLGTTYNVVRKIASRWTFNVRMQAWIGYAQRETLAQRRQEILDMNADHISMSQKLRAKLNDAIDLVDPMALKPGEIVQLSRLAAELERKAMTDTIAQEEMRNELLVGNDNPNLKKTQTKQDDLNEVVSILLKSGALGDVAQLGVKQTTTTTTTTTTEVVGKSEDGSSSTITIESD